MVTWSPQVPDGWIYRAAFINSTSDCCVSSTTQRWGVHVLKTNKNGRNGLKVKGQTLTVQTARLPFTFSSFLHLITNRSLGRDEVGSESQRYTTNSLQCNTNTSHTLSTPWAYITVPPANQCTDWTWASGLGPETDTLEHLQEQTVRCEGSLTWESISCSCYSFIAFVQSRSVNASCCSDYGALNN